MCGRFVLNADTGQVQLHFHLDTVPEVQRRFNIAPTQPVAVITNEAPETLTYHRWGLVPSWAQALSIGNRMINARAETLPEKPAFKSAFKRRRCLIPATGFYEWSQDADGGKQPHYIHLADHDLFAFAGLWETWNSPEGDEIRTCTIITGEPNSLISTLHTRMAVILKPEDYDLWLQPGEMKPADLMPLLLNPYPADQMAAYPVSTLVNSPKNDNPTLIEPDYPLNQPGLL